MVRRPPSSAAIASRPVRPAGRGRRWRAGDLRSFRSRRWTLEPDPATRLGRAAYGAADLPQVARSSPDAMFWAEGRHAESNTTESAVETCLLAVPHSPLGRYGSYDRAVSPRFLHSINDISRYQMRLVSAYLDPSRKAATVGIRRFARFLRVRSDGPAGRRLAAAGFGHPGPESATWMSVFTGPVAAVRSQGPIIYRTSSAAARPPPGREGVRRRPANEQLTSR